MGWQRDRERVFNLVHSPHHLGTLSTTRSIDRYHPSYPYSRCSRHTLQTGNRDIVVHLDLDASSLNGKVDSLARVGVKFAAPKALGRMTWYGKGPHETYCDRSDGALVAVHSCSITELYTPYIYPQGTADVSTRSRPLSLSGSLLALQSTEIAARFAGVRCIVILPSKTQATRYYSRPCVRAST